MPPPPFLQLLPLGPAIFSVRTVGAASSMPVRWLSVAVSLATLERDVRSTSAETTARMEAHALLLIQVGAQHPCKDCQMLRSLLRSHLYEVSFIFIYKHMYHEVSVLYVSVEIKKTDICNNMVHQRAWEVIKYSGLLVGECFK